MVELIKLVLVEKQKDPSLALNETFDLVVCHSRKDQKAKLLRHVELRIQMIMFAVFSFHTNNANIEPDGFMG